MPVRSLGGEDPWKRIWQPTPVSLPGESHGQKSLVCYSPWSHKESDTTESLNNHHQFREYHPVRWTSSAIYTYWLRDLESVSALDLQFFHLQNKNTYSNCLTFQNCYYDQMHLSVFQKASNPNMYHITVNK